MERIMTNKSDALLPCAKEVMQQIALAEAEEAEKQARMLAEAQAEKKALLTDRCNAIRAIVPYIVRDGGGRIIVTASTQDAGRNLGPIEKVVALKLIQRLVRLNLSMRPLPA
jgi:hypothetical protein